jgi:hypothetical protein
MHYDCSFVVTKFAIKYLFHRFPPQVDKNTDQLTERHLKELDRILKVSFNPLSMTLLTDSDKEFLWELRYNILNRSDLLPAFVMGILW